jgi:Immunity protein 26
VARRREGDWFAVPLGEAGYAVGLVARAPKRGDVVFGYFFGPLRAEIPSVEALGGLTPNDAILVTRFFDFAIESGEWLTLGSRTCWERTAWPLPELRRTFGAELTGEHLVDRYSDDNPGKWLGSWALATEAEAATYLTDRGLCAPGYVENVLADAFGRVRRQLPDEDEIDIRAEEGVRAVEEVVRHLRALRLGEVEVPDQREGGIADLEVFQRGPVEDLRASADEVEATLTALAERHGGEYDGREWALPA